MNITLLRLKPALRQLQRIADELQRMNDLRELELAHSGLYARPPKADTSGPEPTATYTDEEADYLRELQEEVGRIERWRESDER